MSETIQKPMRSTEKEDAMSVTMCSSQWNSRSNVIRISWILLPSVAGRVKRRIKMFANIFFNLVAILGIIIISGVIAVTLVALAFIVHMFIHIYRIYKKEKNNHDKN